MNLPKILEAQREFTRERDWDQFHTPKNLVMALAAECGELLEVLQWLTPEQAARLPSDEKKMEALRHEIADVFFYLVRLADKTGVDIEAAFWEKMAQNAKKYPADKSRGSIKKYDEL